MKSEEIIRAEAAVEMRDLAVKAARECTVVLTDLDYEERRLVDQLLDIIVGRIQALRLPASP